MENLELLILLIQNNSNIKILIILNIFESHWQSTLFSLGFLTNRTKNIPAHIHTADVGITMQPDGRQGENKNEFQTFGKVRYGQPGSVHYIV
jgi:hypothetical protein